MTDSPLLPSPDPFPGLTEILAERHEYLTPGLVRYRGSAGTLASEKWNLEATFTGEECVFALLCETDHSVPYAARFEGLPEGVNGRLTRHADFMVAQAWPTPRMYLMRPPASAFESGDEAYIAVGDDRAAEPVDVQIKRVGNAQIWWNAAPEAQKRFEQKRSEQEGEAAGLIWEAILNPRLGPVSMPETMGSGIDPRENPLARWLWDECEAFLRRQSQAAAFTTTRDPAYYEEAFARFLEERGYGRLPAGGGEQKAMWTKKRLTDRQEP